MSRAAGNIFAGLSERTDGEEFRTLFEGHTAKIERIVSHSISSPPGFWYDQQEDEWVMLLRGQATLEFADGEMVELKPGDYLTIPARVRHRVRQTAPQTIWVAAHIR